MYNWIKLNKKVILVQGKRIKVATQRNCESREKVVPVTCTASRTVIFHRRKINFVLTFLLKNRSCFSFDHTILANPGKILQF